MGGALIIAVEGIVAEKRENCGSPFLGSGVVPRSGRWRKTDQERTRSSRHFAESRKLKKNHSWGGLFVSGLSLSLPSIFFLLGCEALLFSCFLKFPPLCLTLLFCQVALHTEGSNHKLSSECRTRLRSLFGWQEVV